MPREFADSALVDRFPDGGLLEGAFHRLQRVFRQFLAEVFRAAVAEGVFEDDFLLLKDFFDEVGRVFPRKVILTFDAMAEQRSRFHGIEVFRDRLEEAGAKLFELSEEEAEHQARGRSASVVAFWERAKLILVAKKETGSGL